MGIVECEKEAINHWSDLLDDEAINFFDGSNQVFSSSISNAEFVRKMYCKFPYFEFNIHKKEFLNCHSSQELLYIHDNSYLGIEDMFGLMGAEDIQFHYPILGREYRDLWNIYTGRYGNNPDCWEEDGHIRNAISCWNILCENLMKFSKNGVYEIPLAELETCIRNGIKAKKRQKKVLMELKELIRKLAGIDGGKPYIVPKLDGEEIVSFTYSSPEIQQLLTKGGEILEIYTYYEIIGDDYFDEVSCGYNFRWKPESVSESWQVTSELDLVLTKGFQSVIIECKARADLSQDFYFKLHSLTELFGIGVKKVLLTTANTSKNLQNKMQVERGELMDIITISDLKQIQNIAKTIRTIL